MNQEEIDALEQAFRRAGFTQAEANFAVSVIRNSVEPLRQQLRQQLAEAQKKLAQRFSDYNTFEQLRATEFRLGAASRDAEVAELRQQLAGTKKQVGAVANEEGAVFGSGDFTIEFHLPPIDKAIAAAAPDDGKWHNVTVSRENRITSVHGQEYIDGVLFVSRKVFDAEGAMREAHYTRADLVKG